MLEAPRATTSDLEPNGQIGHTGMLRAAAQ